MRVGFISFVIVLLDQVVKQLMLHVFALPIWVIPDQVGLQVSMNPGVAFSLPIRGIFAVIISVLIILGLGWYYWKHAHKTFFSELVFGLIFGGAIGNLVDRLWHGSVIDYIRIYSYPSFNIADMAITVGFLLLIWYFDRIMAKRSSLF